MIITVGYFPAMPRPSFSVKEVVSTRSIIRTTDLEILRGITLRESLHRAGALWRTNPRRVVLGGQIGGWCTQPIDGEFGDKLDQFLLALPHYIILYIYMFMNVYNTAIGCWFMGCNSGINDGLWMFMIPYDTLQPKFTWTLKMFHVSWMVFRNGSMFMRRVYRTTRGYSKKWLTHGAPPWTQETSAGLTITWSIKKHHVEPQRSHQWENWRKLMKIGQVFLLGPHLDVYIR